MPKVGGDCGAGGWDGRFSTDGLERRSFICLWLGDFTGGLRRGGPMVGRVDGESGTCKREEFGEALSSSAGFCRFCFLVLIARQGPLPYESHFHSEQEHRAAAAPKLQRRRFSVCFQILYGTPEVKSSKAAEDAVFGD